LLSAAVSATGLFLDDLFHEYVIADTEIRFHHYFRNEAQGVPFEDGKGGHRNGGCISAHKYMRITLINLQIRRRILVAHQTRIVLIQDFEI
jgi:hypothetical protein